MKTKDKVKRVRIEVGDTVTYVSQSGKRYEATVTEVSKHFKDNLFPQVALEFRDQRGKLVRKRWRSAGTDWQVREVYIFPENRWQGRVFYDLPNEEP